MQRPLLRHRCGCSAAGNPTMATPNDCTRPESVSRRRRHSRGSLTRESPHVAAFVLAFAIFVVMAPATYVSASMENPGTDAHTARSAETQSNLEVTTRLAVDDSSVTTDAGPIASDVVSNAASDAISSTITELDSEKSTTTVSGQTYSITIGQSITTQPATELTSHTDDISTKSDFSTSGSSSTDDILSTAPQTHPEVTSGSRAGDSSVTADASTSSNATSDALSEATSPANTNPNVEQSTTPFIHNTDKITTIELVTARYSTDFTVVNTDTDGMSSVSSSFTSSPGSTDDVHSTASETHPEVTTGSKISDGPLGTDASSSASETISNALSEATSPAKSTPDSEQSTTPVSGNTGEWTTAESITAQPSTDLNSVTARTEHTASASGVSISDPSSTDHVHSTASETQPEVTSGSKISDGPVTTGAISSASDAISNTFSEATSPAKTNPDSQQSTTPLSGNTDEITTIDIVTARSSTDIAVVTTDTDGMSSVSSSFISSHSTDGVHSTASEPHPEITSGPAVGGSSVTTPGGEQVTEVISSTHFERTSSFVTVPDSFQSTVSASSSSSTQEITTVNAITSSVYHNATLDEITTTTAPPQYKVEGTVKLSLNYSLLEVNSIREAFKVAVISTIRFISRAKSDTVIKVIDLKEGSIIVNFRIESNSSLQAEQDYMRNVNPIEFKNRLAIEAYKSQTLRSVIVESIITMDPPQISIYDPSDPTSGIEDWLIAVIIVAAIVPLAAIVAVVRCVRKRDAKTKGERDQHHRQPALAGSSRNTVDYEMADGSRNVTYDKMSGGNRSTVEHEAADAPHTGRAYGSRHNSLESGSSAGPGDLRRSSGAVAFDKPGRAADYNYYSEQPRERPDYQGEGQPPTGRLLQYTGDYQWREALANLVAASRSASSNSRSAAAGARYTEGPWRPNSNISENPSESQYQQSTFFQRRLLTFGKDEESGFSRDSSRAFPRLVRTSYKSRPAPDYEG